MRVKIRSVADKGNFEKERLILDVGADTDIGDYILLCTGYNNGSVTTYVRKTLWFPYQRVSRSDIVVVYTKDGRSSERKRKDGSTAWFHYFDLPNSIWDNDDWAAVLLYAPEWNSKGPDEL